MAGIRVELELVDGNFTSRMARAGQSMDQFNRQAAGTDAALRRMAGQGVNVIRNIDLQEKATRGLLSTMRDLSIVAGMVMFGISKVSNVSKGWVGDITRINMEMERLNFQMRAMSRAADPIKDAADTVDYLRQKSLQMPFSLKAITDGFVKMKATGTDPLNGSLEKLADGVAAAGGTDESFQRTILAISQISGKGVLQMEELRQQLGESMPRAVELMARSMGVSMATLIRDISTGTVSAKPALAAFYDELDRTYGGRARMMMQTFGGQLQKTKTLLQTLSSSGTLKTEFFDGALRQQLRDINQFLESRAAERLRDDLGNGLSAVVTTIRSVVDGVINMRNEISRFAMVLAGVFAFRGAVAGSMAFLNVINSTREGLVIYRAQLAIVSREITTFQVVSATAGTASMRMGAAVNVVGASLKAAALGISAIAPWLTAIGLTVYTAAEYFGIFSNKVGEAYEQMVKFGAETRKQAEETNAAKRTQLTDRLAAMEKASTMSSPGAWADKIAETRREIAELDAKFKTIYADAGRREDQRMVDDFRDKIDGKMRALQQAYDTEFNATVDHYNQLEEEASKNGRSVKTIQEQRQEAYEGVQRNYYRRQIDALKEMQESEKRAMEGQGAFEKAQAEKRIAEISDRLARANQAYESVRVSGVQRVQKPTNDEKALERGEKLVERLKSELAGVEEELDGGFSSVGELQALIADGRFGDTTREEVKTLADKAIALQTDLELSKQRLKQKKDENRAFENGKDYVKKLTADISGLKAELSGADFDVAQLESLLDSGKYGPASKKAVQEQIAEIKALIAEREKLKDQTKALREANQKFDNGENALNSLNAEVAGLSAGLAGANKEVVELQKLLASGKYGSQDEERVRALTQSLMEAQRAKEALDKLMKGKTDLERDVKSAREAADERLLKARLESQGKELTEAEKVKFKIENGYYEGFGSQSRIQKSMKELVDSFRNQGVAAEALGITIRDNTFGGQTQNQIETATNKLREMAGVVTQIGQNLSGLNFGNAFAGLNGSMMGPGNPVFGAGSGSILELIAKVESGGDYNKTLDNGAWTGGPQNLVGMTLNQVRELQRMMLANPANRAKYGKGKGSSALGKYQIVGQTLEGLMSSMGLSGNELYDEKMQDAMAMRLLKGRQGQGMAGLREEWEGLKNVPDAQIQSALNGSTNGPTRENAMALNYGQANSQARSYADTLQTVAALTERQEEAQRGVVTQLDEIGKVEQEAQGQEFQNKRAKALEELKAKAVGAKKPIDELGKNYQAVLEKIAAGELGASKSADAKEYQTLLTAAKDLDRVEEEMAQKKKARTTATNAQDDFAQRQIELNRRASEAMARITDPMERKSSSAFRAMESDLDDYVRKVQEAYGKDSTAARDAAAYRTDMLRSFRNTEVAERAAGYAKDAKEIRRGLMSERQQRQAALQEQIEQIDRDVAAFQGTEEQKVEIVRAAEAKKAALRAQAAQAADPMSRQMQEWGDIQTNLAQASTRWMDSLAGGLTDLVMGTGDLKSVINGMLKDIINMGIKSMMSGMFQKGGAGAGAAKGGAAKGGSAKASKGKSVGLYHTGGLIGGVGSGTRSVPGSLFSGAQKYHTGDIIGAPRLSAGEVPIIGKRGEGVFTPSQMKALGPAGGQSVTINAPVTVNSNGGSPEQNADLAERTAQAMERTVRGLVANELRTQLRPGNMLNTKTR